METKLKLASFFSGAGGLDLGFEQAGFSTAWANEYDRTIWESYEKNFPHVHLDKRSITEIESQDIPDVDGIIGGPPCQSWSEAGALRGASDPRGQLFFDYMNLVGRKMPKFFVAENVSGILSERHSGSFGSILEGFAEMGYNVSLSFLNANDYGVAQDRQRVFIVGYRSDFNQHFFPPSPQLEKPVLRDVIYDLRDSAVPAGDKNKANSALEVPNHEYMTGGFSTIYMSRNRVRPWEKPSFTIQAGGRHAPLHPQAPEMVSFGPNDKRFVQGKEHLYRRLTVREAARVQGFPDSYIFYYQSVTDGYKMVGNAVPVGLARSLAMQIMNDLQSIDEKNKGEILPGTVKNYVGMKSREHELSLLS